jgi:hypothetical protein
MEGKLSKKTAKIEVLCNPNEFKRIHEKALKLGLKDGAYLRILGLNSKITVREVYQNP